MILYHDRLSGSRNRRAEACVPGYRRPRKLDVLLFANRTETRLGRRNALLVHSTLEMTR